MSIWPTVTKEQPTNACLFHFLLNTSGSAVSFVNDEEKKRVIWSVDLTLDINEGDEDALG